MEKTKQEHFTEIITEMLNRDLEDLKKIVNEIEGILSADLIDIDTKAIRTLEAFQKVKFDTSILRELQVMKRP